MIVKYSTKRGQELVNRGTKWEGFDLYQVYDNWSSAKQRAWDWCFDKYMNTPNHEQFSICSHNTFQFSVSWLGDYTMEDGSIEPAMFLETANNSYIILLDR